MTAGLVIAVAAYLIAKPYIGPMWQKPGTPVLQSIAAVGGLLLLMPFVFSIGKRAGMSEMPNRLFMMHVGASVLGIFFVALHAVAAFDGPPLFMVAFLIGLVVTGYVGRVHLAPRIAATFGTKAAPFQAPDEQTRSELRRVIDEKTALLKSLDPGASEALFSVTPRHLIRRPVLSLAYMKLARREETLIGARGSVTALQAWWRPLHMALAWLFLGGLIVHVIFALFFAGYVAEGREIYWWHITDW